MLKIYNASAGSGKTHQLTEDYIRLLFSHQSLQSPHRRILAVTFTNKATAEMKSRILSELHNLSEGAKSDFRNGLMNEFGMSEVEVNEQARKILVNILHDYSSFSISTIDRFFQQIIRSFAREIGVHGDYELQLDTDDMLQQAVDNLFLNLSEKENKQLLEWLNSYMMQQIDDSKSWNIKKQIAGLGGEIFKESFQQQSDVLYKKLHEKSFLRNYQAKLQLCKQDFVKEVERRADDLLNFLNENGLRPENFTRKMMFSTLEKLKNGSFDLGKIFLGYAESPENCYTKAEDKNVKNIIDDLYHRGLQERLNDIILNIQSGIILYNTADVILKNLNTLGILADLSNEIRKITNDQNLLLISDANSLLSKIIDNSETPFIYERTGVNIAHYMMDEFQDTSKLQWNNFRPLVKNSMAEGNYDMLVGDVKQSIYRWRNSDWNLLDEKVDEDFAEQEIEHVPLDTNWRSDKNIVSFNNTFFPLAATQLQSLLNANIGDNPSERLAPLQHKITHAYQDVHQRTRANAGAGHVKFEFIPIDDELKWDELVLNKLPMLLESLVDKGYKPCEVTFLVRDNQQAKTVIEFILQYKNRPEARPDFSYEMVGSEGLKLTTSHSVNFIVSVLSVIFNPEDDLSRMRMNFEYCKGKLKLSEEESIRRCFKVNDESPLFTKEERLCLQSIHNLSLYDAVEEMIRIFCISEWYHEAVFLQAFQDNVFKFSANQCSDLSTFIQWWNDSAEKIDIPMPDNENAFKIMTIHKSKGLESKVIIIPFCDWDLYQSRNILWCEPTEKPFSDMPLVPVNITKLLANTIFNEDYFEEIMNQYIDNLNLAYVAFTRSRNELYSFLPLPKISKSKSEEINILKVNDLIYSCLTHNEELQPYWTEENIFEMGEMQMLLDKEKSLNERLPGLTDYPIVPYGERLQIRHTAIEAWETTSILDNRLNYGVLMHEILQNTQQKGDDEKMIDEMVRQGKLNESEAEEIRQELVRFWSLPETENWFDREAEVLNEATILLPGGTHFRPDRIVLKNQSAIVVDYKFGNEQRNSYSNQLKQYADLIRQMGFQVEAWLYYVSLGELLKIV